MSKKPIKINQSSHTDGIAYSLTIQLPKLNFSEKLTEKSTRESLSR